MTLISSSILLLSSILVIVFTKLNLFHNVFLKNKIDYINTHGTSTPVGDITELKAVGETFKDRIP